MLLIVDSDGNQFASHPIADQSVRLDENAAVNISSNSLQVGDHDWSLSASWHYWGSLAGRDLYRVIFVEDGVSSSDYFVVGSESQLIHVSRDGYEIRVIGMAGEYSDQ